MPSFSGYWNEGSPAGYSLPTNKYGEKAAKRLINRVGSRMFNTLIGAVPGAVVTESHRRVANTSANAGLRVMETFTDFTKTTDTTDVAILKSLVVTDVIGPGFYPADKGGNGGKAF